MAQSFTAVGDCVGVAPSDGLGDRWVWPMLRDERFPSASSIHVVGDAESFMLFLSGCLVLLWSIPVEQVSRYSSQKFLDNFVSLAGTAGNQRVVWRDGGGLRGCLVAVPVGGFSIFFARATDAIFRKTFT